jgi:Domain of Unknown Function with PDB structure (DUF3857)
MKHFFTILLIFSLVHVFANDELERIDYDWEAAPHLTKVNITDTNISVYYLKNFSSSEFIYENGELYEYRLLHRKIKLLTEKGIEAYNTLYLPIYDESDYLVVKARVINGKGEIIELKEEDIKEGVDEETETKYKYFAFDGVDKGSEIEYFYIYKRNPVHTGSLFNVQKEYPQLDFDYEIITPWNLIFDFKSYNGLAELVYDSTLYESKEKNRWEIHLDTVIRLPNQASSAHEAELQYFGYKLSENTYTGGSDLFSYGQFSRIIYEMLYTTLSKKEKSFIKKRSKELDVDGFSEEKKIREIEDFVKENMLIGDFSFTADITLQEMWEIGIADEIAAMKLFIYLYGLFDIEARVALSCDRFEMKFDKSFELWSYPSEYLLYFPSVDKYTRVNMYDRLGYVDYSYINNHALVIKEFNLSNENYGIGEVKFIPPNDYKNTGDTLIVKADIQKHGFADMKYDVYHSVSGYKADFYQTTYEYISDEDSKKEIEEILLKFLDENAELEDFETRNLSIKDYGIKPAIGEGILISDVFVEKAGNNYLFKIGELIGPQMEMYDEEERVLPVEEVYTRHYHRVIVFTIPDDYILKNIENLKINEAFTNDEGEEMLGFHSNYTIDGNTVTVVVAEFYQNLYYALEDYEDYRHIVNMAADFNKIVLIFEKQ